MEYSQDEADDHDMEAEEEMAEPETPVDDMEVVEEKKEARDRDMARRSEVRAKCALILCFLASFLFLSLSLGAAVFSLCISILSLIYPRTAGSSAVQETRQNPGAR